MDGKEIHEDNDKFVLYVAKHLKKYERDRQIYQNWLKQKEEINKSQHGKNLIITNLADDINEEQLITLFKQFGEI